MSVLHHPVIRLATNAMSDHPRYLDIVEGPSARSADSGSTPRPSIQVWFACANAYQRVFRSVNGDRYSARCPKCGKQIGFAVGRGGTNQRLFEVRC